MAILEGPEHVFTLANRAYLDLVGNRDIIGRPIAEALPEVVEQGFVAAPRQRARASRRLPRPRRAVMLQRTPGRGARRAFPRLRLPADLDNAGDVDGIFVQGHDVTEQKRAELAIRESETRFRLVAETAPVMLWMSDPAGHCVYLNACSAASGA